MLLQSATSAATATANPSTQSSTPQQSTGRTLAPGPSLGVYRGGSLPNVSDQLLAAAVARQQQQQHLQTVQQTVLLPPTQLILQQKKFIVLTALPQDDMTPTPTTTTMTDSISVKSQFSGPYLDVARNLFIYLRHRLSGDPFRLKVLRTRNSLLFSSNWKTSLRTYFKKENEISRKSSIGQCRRLVPSV